MLIKTRAGWELPESAATPQSIFEDRRRLIKGLAAGPILLSGAGVFLSACEDSGPAVAAASGEDPTKGLYPVKRNLSFRGGRAMTEEKWAINYNNYYEFGSHKQIASRAQALPIRPWTITLDGMVEKKQVIDIDTLIKKMPLEERVYRHRCVEAWSMVVPWSGFPLKSLLDLAKPLGSAKYVRMQTFLNPKVARGQTQTWYPWPYTEGLTIAEAANNLAFMVTGLYGKPVPKQSGAPLRLAAPWKYGFKSIKSITRFTFTDKRPVTFWQETGPREYGFWANVNPEVPHPRWSQASERVLGTNERVPTQLFNGYGEQVAALYKDIKGEKLFM